MCVCTTDLLLLHHSWERAGHLSRYTCWVWNRIHRHRNSCKLLERREERKVNLIGYFIFHNNEIGRIITGLCGIEEELTDDTLVPSRESLPAWTAVWMEARATHIGPDRDKKKEQINSLLTQTSQTSFSKTPKQIHRVMSYFLSCQRPARPLLSE